MIADSANASISLRILPNALFTTLSTSVKSDASSIASFPNLINAVADIASPNVFAILPILDTIEFIPVLNSFVLILVLILISPSYPPAICNPHSLN